MTAESVFVRLFNVSAAAVWLVLAVLLARLVLRRAPKWTRLLLWALVAVRLIVPFSVESPISLVPSAETIRTDVVTSEEPRIHTGIDAINSVVNPILQGGAESGEVGVGDAAGREGEGALPANDGAARSVDGGETAIPQSPAPAFEASVDTMQTAIRIASVVWLCGVGAMLGYALASYMLLRRRVREAVAEDGRVWTCDRVPSPFILGLIRPKIILPSSLPDGEREMALAHERAHLRRADHVWKPLGFLLLAVNWYNPAIWLAYVLLCRDIELACDERVIRTLGESAKAQYSRALIGASVTRRSISACPLAFGENDVKGRVKNVLNYKKPAFWIVIAAILVCAAVAVFFLTSPKKPDGGETPAQSGESTVTDQKPEDESGMDDPSDGGESVSWAMSEDYSTKELLGMITYRLEKENGDKTGNDIPDGYVMAWTDRGAEGVYFYVTVNKSVYSPDSSRAVYYENIIYADAFLCGTSCDSVTLFDPYGFDPATRDKNDIPAGYPTVVLTDRKDMLEYRIDVIDGRIILSDGENELHRLESANERDIALEAVGAVPREVWYCELPIIDGVYNDRSVLKLFPEKHWALLSFGSFSGFILSEEYSEDDDTLTFSNGSYKYAFRKVDGALEYDVLHSTGPTYGAFGDGALFRRDLYLDPIYSHYDTATFDINGDGVDERVGIGMGMTSGVFTFTVTATAENGEYVCGGWFRTKFYPDIRFAERNGERVIEATDTDGNTDVLHIRAFGSVVELTNENGEPINADRLSVKQIQAAASGS